MPKNSQPPLTSESQHLEPGPPDIILISLPSDGGYGWIIALMAFLMNLICDGVINNFGKLLTEISQELNVPESQVAVIGSIFTGIHFFSGPFASALINRFGFRRCGIVGALIATVFMYLSSVSVNYVHLAIYHGICGIGTGILACVASICVGYHFDKYRPFALGIATSGTGAGTFAMEPFINWIIADSLENAGHWKLFMKWESVVLMTGMVMSLFAAKPKTLSMKEKVSQAGETKSWFQRIFRQSVDENESSSSQDDISIRNFTARQSAWSFQTYKSPRLSIVGAPEQPTLAEMIYVHDDELLQIKKDQEFRKNNRKFRFYQKFHKSFHAPKGIGKKIMRTLPLHRDDILYSQSATKFAERRAEELNLGLPLGCSEDNLLNNHLLLTRAPVEFLHNSKIKKFCLHLKHSLKMVFVISMFKSWTFNVLCVGSFCYAAGLFVPFMYLTDRAVEFKMQKNEAMWLVSVIGLGNIVLRLCIGALVTIFPQINATKFTAFSMIVSGISTIVTAFFPHHPFSYQATYCMLFALGNACLMALRSIVYCDMFGVERLTSIYGIMSAMMGFGILLGTPTLGMLKELTGSYTWTFIASGSFLIASGICHSILPIVRKWEEEILNRNIE